MPGLFSPSSTTIATPFAGNAGFSETGQATSVNVNLSGKVKAKGSIQPVINLTDQGALNAALELSSKSIKSIELLGSTLSSALTGLGAQIRGQGNDLIEAVSSANRTSIDAVSSANRSEVENLGLTAIKFGTLALGAFFLFRALTVKT